jgi:hypothetical protein
MTGKQLLTASLILPLIAIASAAYADPTTKRHAPNHAQSYLFRDTAARAQAGVEVYPDYRPTPASCTYQYQGGPKSSLWTCRR